MIVIDYRDHRPIYEQIIDRIKELILNGVLEPNSQLPSVRNLAMDLSINPNTIQRAYAELERQGFILSVKGKGNFVAGNDKLIQEKRKEVLEKLQMDVQEGIKYGISQDQMIDIINRYFGGGIKGD